MQPSPVVDAHTHVASSDTHRFPLRGKPVGSQWFTAGNVGAEDLLAQMRPHGVDRAVIVQAVGAYGYDCSYAIEAVRDHASQLALVGAIDMDAAHPAQAFASLHAAAGSLLRGMRLFGVLGTAPAWLSDRRAEDVWNIAEQLGVTIVPTLFPAALPQFAEVARRYPNVPAVIEHIGFVDLTGGAPFPNAQPLFDLAAIPSVHVKVTSHSLEHASEVGDPADLLDLLAARFGADRLLWGSDFPQTQGHSYAEMLALAHHAARRLTPEDQARFLGGTALKLWWNVA